MWMPLKVILQFSLKQFPSCSTSDRSLTQIEALLEGHAYGGPVTMKETALQMMVENQVRSTRKLDGRPREN